MLHILLLKRCDVINDANICLDLNVLRKKAYFMCKYLKKA